jgi:hypothetical protein
VLTALFAALNLSASLASSSAASTRYIAGDGAVVAPEGARFRLPRGFTYSVVERPGAPRGYAAQSGDGQTVAMVSVIQSEGEFGCDGPEAAQLGLAPFETAKGYAGCRVVLQPDDSPLAVAMELVNAGAAVVSVTVFARTTRAASAAASAVSATIEIERALAAGRAAQARTVRISRADPRLFGCFTTSDRRGDREPGGVYMGSFTSVTTLCLREDFTFGQTDERGAMLPGGGGVLQKDETEGAWAYAEGFVTLTYKDEDGTPVARELKVGRIDDHAVVLDGATWERTEVEEDEE